MKAPDKIYMPNELLSEEWGRHIEGQDTEYIRKDTLLEWAKEQWLHTRNGTMADQIRSSAYEEMMKHIESL